MSNRIFKFSKNEIEETLEMTQLAELQSQLTVANEQLAEMTSVKEQLALLTTAVASKETALASALTELTEMKEAAVTAKLDSRKSKLEAVMSKEQASTITTALASLDDEAFGIALAGYAGLKQAVEASDLFNEIGDQGTEAVVETESASKAKAATENLIKQKLGLA